MPKRGQRSSNARCWAGVNRPWRSTKLRTSRRPSLTVKGLGGALEPALSKGLVISRSAHPPEMRRWRSACAGCARPGTPRGRLRPPCASRWPSAPGCARRRWRCASARRRSPAPSRSPHPRRCRRRRRR
ncbi:hypothetical protein G6F46_015151 [Rhizopus delemar]|nr:hypothetical protein G6F46_015151 [Rhizopus delemar]